MLRGIAKVALAPLNLPITTTRLSGLRAFSSTSAETSQNISAPAEIELQHGDNTGIPAPKIDAFGRSYGTGRRKTSIARVWIMEGSGQFTINGMNWTNYFSSMSRDHVVEPFLATGTAGQFDIACTVKGGGIMGQAGAIRLGVSRAMLNYYPLFRAPLHGSGLLTRDSRRVERKKPGQHKARKKYQWVKR